MFFLNIVIKKSGFDIYLFHVLIYNHYKRKDRFIIYKFHYQRENVIIIIILLLFEFSNNSIYFIINDFFREISLYNVNLIIF